MELISKEKQAPMNNTDLYALLIDWGACTDSLHWLGLRNSTQMWNECRRADWMIWWLCSHYTNSSDIKVSIRDLVSTVFDCIEPVLLSIRTSDPLIHIAAASLSEWLSGTGPQTRATLHQLGLKVLEMGNKQHPYAFEYYSLRILSYLLSAGEIPSMSVQAVSGSLIAFYKLPINPIAVDKAHKQMCGVIRER